jgi:K(+)-stimulated pyrophosphate-energized sodium pump
MQTAFARMFTRALARKGLALAALVPAFLASAAFAGEADIKLPDVAGAQFAYGLNGWTIMMIGLGITVVGMLFGLLQYKQTVALPAHKSMLAVSNIIWETCKSYIIQQGKYLSVLWLLIAVAIIGYFGFLSPIGQNVEPGQEPINKWFAVVVVLLASVLGILGSYGVAWFGIRINTQANSRAAFASLKGYPLPVLGIPLKSGMSIGMLLVSVELFFMICILCFLPKELVGPSFIGFAIGESLGASALRICGGIFTKIADIGADLMKIVFKLPEDDPKNPGVIADCTGDNAGDSVGPTADGFETYGVTGVALIVFIALTLGVTGVEGEFGAKLIVWLFAMRALMIVTSLVSYFINEAISKAKYATSKDFHEEAPLTWLVWITSILSIVVTFAASYVLLKDAKVGELAMPNLWWALSVIISCGTIAGAVIPEFTKVFTSTTSGHVKEVVTASKQGGASLNILSGFVAGNFSAFWKGLVIAGLMGIGWWASTLSGADDVIAKTYTFAGPIFAFGLIAFGFLGMGPVTIAVDSFGPVTDNAQSVYELSRIEAQPGIKDEIKRDFGFDPDFDSAKYTLEKGDGAGNTFKATAKPVLIGTAVVGATTMVFSIILELIKANSQKLTDLAPEAAVAQAAKAVVEKLSIVEPSILLGLLIGGSVIYWFTGAATQAVVTGAYGAVVFIKKNINLDKAEASIADAKEVVRICTVYAQKGMTNIFMVVFFFSLGLPFFDPYFFVGYLIAISFFGLFQAIFMANAGGAWDNAKKIVEVEMRMKGTDLHAATVVGDTVGDPFKDTSSVALNPVIKFTTLFGLLAVAIAIKMEDSAFRLPIGIACSLIACFFVWRSFYGMRIPADAKD